MRSGIRRLGMAGVCLAAGLAVCAPISRADDSPTNDAQRIEKLEQENQALKERLDKVEAKEETAIQAPPAAQAPPPGIGEKTLDFLDQTTIGGFVTASYFYDFHKPPPGGSTLDGLTFTRYQNSFSLNEAALQFQKPVKNNGDNWDVGYRLELIWGTDAPILNNGPALGGFDALREAYVELNVPIGNGLDIKAGQLISLLNFEAGDQVLNPNFSQGNQWYFTGNGPGSGVQLGYAINDKVDVELRVQNGLFVGAIDNNDSKTFMGRIGIKPDDKTTIAFFGFGGPEGTADNRDWLDGASMIATRDLTKELHAATEIDYFHAQHGDPTTGGDAQWWSMGGWLWYDFTKQVMAAVRCDYVDDLNGGGTSGLLGFPTVTSQQLFSATLTLNYSPMANVQIRPEIRYDHTSQENTFNGTNERIMAGMGIGYTF